MGKRGKTLWEGERERQGYKILKLKATSGNIFFVFPP